MPHSTTNIGLLKRISCIFIDIAAKKEKYSCCVSSCSQRSDKDIITES